MTDLLFPVHWVNIVIPDLHLFLKSYVKPNFDLKTPPNWSYDKMDFKFFYKIKKYIRLTNSHIFSSFLMGFQAAFTVQHKIYSSFMLGFILPM